MSLPVLTKDPSGEGIFQDWKKGSKERMPHDARDIDLPVASGSSERFSKRVSARQFQVSLSPPWNAGLRKDRDFRVREHPKSIDHGSISGSWPVGTVGTCGFPRTGGYARRLMKGILHHADTGERLIDEVRTRRTPRTPKERFIRWASLMLLGAKKEMILIVMDGPWKSRPRATWFQLDGWCAMPPTELTTFRVGSQVCVNWWNLSQACSA